MNEEFDTSRKEFEAWLCSCWLVGGTFADHYRLMDRQAKREVDCSWLAWQASRKQAVAECAEKLDAMNDKAGDRASYDNREMYAEEAERMHTLMQAAAAIRAMQKD